MKRFLHTTIYGLALLLSVASCNNESLQDLVEESEAAGRTTLEVTSDSPLLTMDEVGVTGEIKFKSRGGEITLDVVTNRDEWSYTSTDAEWLNIESDNHFLRINTEQNTSESERTATITLTAGKGGGKRRLRIA